MGVVLVSAAFGKKYRGAKRRFVSQFNSSKVVDKLFIFDDQWISSLNLGEKSNLFISKFVWKPYVVSEVMSQLVNQDILIYLDIGCEFNDEMLSRAIDCIRFNGSTFMRLDHSLISWISPHLLGKGPFLEVNSDDPCVAAGTLFLIKNDITSKLIAEWLEWTMVSDYMYAIGGGVKNHRHDQSILSAIISKYNFYTINDNCYVTTSDLLNKSLIENSFAIVLRNKSYISMLWLRKILVSYFYFLPRKLILKIYCIFFKITQIIFV